MRKRRPPASPTEVALNRATSRASNTYALIDKSMRLAMGTLKKGKFAPAAAASDQASTYVRALYRDMVEISTLIRRMGQEIAAPEQNPASAAPVPMEVPRG